MAVALYAFLEKKIKARSIFIVVEDRLPGIAAEHHVINSVWIMNAWFACHKRSLVQLFNLSILTPFLQLDFGVSATDFTLGTIGVSATIRYRLWRYPLL